MANVVDPRRQRQVDDVDVDRQNVGFSNNQPSRSGESGNNGGSGFQRANNSPSPQLTPITQVKRLSPYTDAKEIQNLVERLQRVVTSEGLVNGQKVTVKLAGSNQPVELTTETRPPSHFTQEQRKKLLFLRDLASFEGAIGKSLYSINPTSELGAFTPDKDDQTILTSLGKHSGDRQADGNQISEAELEKNSYQLKGFLNKFHQAAEKINSSPQPTLVGETEETTEQVDERAEREEKEKKDLEKGAKALADKAEAKAAEREEESEAEAGEGESPDDKSDNPDETKQATDETEQPNQESSPEPEQSSEKKTEKEAQVSVSSQNQSNQAKNNQPASGGSPPDPAQINKEANWFYQQAVFELFSAHGITEGVSAEHLPLQRELQSIKGQIYQQIVDDLSSYSNTELTKLYLNKQLRREYLPTLYKKLNLNEGLSRRLANYYQSLGGEYERSGNKAKKEQLQDSLQDVVAIDSAGAEIVDKRPDSKTLFSQQLLATINSDNQILLNSVGSTLDSMLLVYGLAETQRLVAGVNPEMLEITFGLPKGSIGENNSAQLRELLSNYSLVRSANLERVSDLPQQGMVGYGGLGPKEFDYSTSTDADYTKRVAPVISTREVIKDNSPDGEGTDVAAAVAPNETHKKVQKSLALIDEAWKGLNPVEQMAIYMYYGLPIPSEVQNEFKRGGRLDPNLSLPAIFNYLDFEQMDPDQRFLDEMVSYIQKLKGKVFTKDPNLNGLQSYIEEKQGKLSEKNKKILEEKEKVQPDYKETEKHVKKVAELQTELATATLAQLEAAEQLRIAQELGYQDAKQLYEAYNQTIYVESVTQQDGSARFVPMVNYQLAAAIPSSAQIALQRDEIEAGRQQSFLSRIPGIARPRSTPTPRSAGGLLANTLKKGAAKKLTRKAFQKGAAGALAKAGTKFIPGIGTALAIAQNKRARQIAAGLATAAVASTLFAISTVGGAIGGVVGGAVGTLVGPLGSIGGSIAGANIGAKIWPTQWGKSVGFTPRQPPNMADIISPEQPISPSETNMSALREGSVQGGEQAAINTQIPEQGASFGGGKGLASQIPPNSVMNPNAVVATSAKAGAATGASYAWFTSLSPAIVAPLLGVIGIAVSSWLIILIASGAFIVPLPTRDTLERSAGSAVDDGSQFVEITKTPSVREVENNTAVDVTYTITVKPRGNYSIVINEATDQFSGFGTSSPNLVSKVSDNFFPVGQIGDEFTNSYTVSFGDNIEDTMVNNTLSVWFDVIDANGYTVVFDQKYIASASVKVGDPPVGCWPTSGVITGIPYPQANGDYYSHTKHKEDAFDIANGAGEPVYSPFEGEACRIDRYSDRYADGYGRSVKLSTTIGGENFAFIFAHLESAVPKLATVNDDGCIDVGPGSLLGTMDSDGNSSGDHLHYELSEKPAGSNIYLKDLVIDGGLAIQQTLEVNKAGGIYSVNHCFR